MSGQATKLYQRIAESIAAAIQNDTFPIGSRLPSERDLAETYQVSRPTVREAMIALEIRELVEARKGSGVYVKAGKEGFGALGDLDVGAFELIEARMLIEGEAAALAATSIDEEAIRTLRDLLHAMNADHEHPDALRHDREFHMTIASATGNSIIQSMVEKLWSIRERSPLCIHMFARARREGITPRVDEHELVVDALAARDPQRARQMMRNHLKRVTEDLLDGTRVELAQQAQADYDAQRQRIARRTSA